MFKRFHVTLIAAAALAAAALACNIPGFGGTPVPPTSLPPGFGGTGIPPASPTSVPAVPPTTAPEATLPPAPPAPSVLVHTADNQLVQVDTQTGAQTPLATLSFEFYPGPYMLTGMAGDTLVVVGYQNNQPAVFSITGGNATPLDFITQAGGGQPNGIAVWPGDGNNPPRIAWSVSDFQNATNGVPSALFTANLDGSNVQQIASQTSELGSYLIPWRWSDDGQSLFYSIEPSGLGGYIPFGGYSSLYRYDMGSGAVDATAARRQLAHHLRRRLLGGRDADRAELPEYRSADDPGGRHADHHAAGRHRLHADGVGTLQPRRHAAGLRAGARAA